MAGLTIRNPGFAGQSVLCPDGSTATFDHEGVAKDLKATCGLNLVPGYELLDGEPEVVITVEKKLAKPNGPPVICLNSAMAGQSVLTPSGYGPVTFDANGQAAVPDNCGLDLIPGYRFVDDKGEPVEGKFEPEENLVVAGSHPALTPDQKLEADWRSQQEATKPTVPPKQQDVDMPPPKSEVEKQKAAQAAANAEKDETSKGHADHGKHGHAIQKPQPKPPPKGSRPVASVPPAHAKVPAPAPAGREAHASLYEAAQVAEEAE